MGYKLLLTFGEQAVIEHDDDGLLYRYQLGGDIRSYELIDPWVADNLVINEGWTYHGWSEPGLPFVDWDAFMVWWRYNRTRPALQGV